MAGVESAKKALWALLRSFNANRTAKLTVTTAKGKLKVTYEESFDKHCNVKASTKSLRRVSPSQLRRKERRAADPAVQQRAAEHQAREARSACETELALPSPEKERGNSVNKSLSITPVKEVVRDEVGVEVEEEVAKLPRVQVPHAATKTGEVLLASPEKERASFAFTPLETSPVRDDIREEVEAEEEVEKRPRLQVPEDYEDRANNDLWDWDANSKKVKEADKLLRETDRCCFCDFDCPPPSEQDNKGRLFGVLESLCDHIELSHPLAFEWLDSA